MIESVQGVGTDIDIWRRGYSASDNNRIKEK